MAQIHPDRRLSFSLPSQKAGQKQKGQILAVSAQLMALVSALRSLSSVALSSARVSPVYHPFLMPLRQGDISTLQNRGHLYFALTLEKYLPLVDRSLFGSAFTHLCSLRAIVTMLARRMHDQSVTFEDVSAIQRINHEVAGLTGHLSKRNLSTEI